MKKPLIAQVATAVVINGQRQIIPAGQPLPELDTADEAALLATKAARQAPDTAGTGEGDGAPAAATAAVPKGKK